MSKSSISILLSCMFTLTIFSGGNRYTGIFTLDIYNQDAILRDYERRRSQPGLTQEQLDDLERELELELEQALIAKKKMKIEEKVVKKIKAQVDELFRREQRKAERDKKRAVVNIIAGVFDFLGSFVRFQWGDSVRAATGLADGSESSKIVKEINARRVAIGESARQLSPGTTTLGTAIFDLLDASEILNTKVSDVFDKAEEIGLSVAEFKCERDSLLNLDNDPLHQYEVAYVVKKKRFLPKELQQKAENKFITGRDVSGLGTEQYRDYFINILCIPTTKKQIGRDRDPDVSARLLLQKFRENRNFQSYAEEEQTELKKFMITALYASRTSYHHSQPLAFEENPDGAGPANPEPSRPYLRRGFYFFGPPGAGKTMGARESVQFLGLPCCQKTVLSAGSVSEEKLLGTSMWGGDSHGWLVDALLAQDDQGKVYRNSVLILDDFDRVVVGVQKENSPLPFLLWVLDPGTDMVESRFFESKLDISDMFFILTGNQDLRARSTQQQVAVRQQAEQQEAPARVDQSQRQAGVVVLRSLEDPESFDDMQALRRRLKTITFSSFTPERRESILCTQMANLIHFFHAPEYQPLAQDFLIDRAMRERDLSDGLILLSERMLDYKINMLSAQI